MASAACTDTAVMAKLSQNSIRLHREAAGKQHHAKLGIWQHSWLAGGGPLMINQRQT